MGKFRVLFSISIIFNLLCSALVFAESAGDFASDADLFETASASVYRIPKIYDQLDASQKARIQSGQYLEFTKFFAGEAWPQVVVIQRVNATPEEAMAIFADFRSHAQYIHRVASSVVYPTADPKVSIIDYRLELSSVVSSVFDPQYRVQTRLIQGEEGSYQTAWSLVASRDMARVEGKATFEALPGGGTLIYYSTLMTPRLDRNFIVVRLLKSQKVVDSIARGAWKALGSIVARIEYLKVNAPNEVQRDVERFRNIMK